MARLPHIRNPFAHRENYEDAARAVAEFNDPRPFAKSVWDYKLGFGKSPPGQQIMMAYPLGGRWAPKTPGTRLESLHYGDSYLNHEGRLTMRHGDSKRNPGGTLPWGRTAGRDRELFDVSEDEFNHHVESWEGASDWLSASDPGFRAYNLIDEKSNKVIGSVSAARGKGRETMIPSLYVDPKYRKTGAMFDLVNAATHGGKLKPSGGIVNARLQRVFNRRFDPERQKVLDKVAKAVKPIPPKKPTQLDHDIRQLRLEAESGRRFQVTNRDIGHPLTPVRRPVQPRPARPQRLTPTQQQLRLSNELRDRRRGGV